MKQTVTNGAAPFLYEEIIINILKRLPVKSLIRFQCVCKDWKNLFNTPHFIRDHLHHHSTHQNPSLLFQKFRSGYPFKLCLLDCELQFHEFENAPSVDFLDRLYLVGSCNGLLCLAYNLRQPPVPILWNPATREFRQTPITSNDSPLSWRLGFGFSPIVNDYKIVRFSENDTICRVEVFSLSTGSWRNIDFDCIKDFCIRGYCVTINGVMSWCGSRRLGCDNYVIISLDLATEVFMVTSLPAFSGDFGVTPAVYEDKLAIISRSSNLNSQYDASFYFGVMEEGGLGSSGERWSSSKKYIGNCDPFQIFAGVIWKNQIVCIDLLMSGFSGATVDEIQDFEPKLGLYLINVTTKEHKRFAFPRFAFPRYRDGFIVYVCSYVESLVRIGNIQH